MIAAADSSSNVYVAKFAGNNSEIIYAPVYGGGGGGGSVTSNAGTGWTGSGLATAALQNAFGPPVQGTPLVMTGGGGQVTETTCWSLVKAVNVGANPAWCQTGSSYTGITSGHYLAGAGSTWAFTPGAATALACQSVTGSTTVNTEGGGGPAVDTGGGGGGGGGAITPR